MRYSFRVKVLLHGLKPACTGRARAGPSGRLPDLYDPLRLGVVPAVPAGDALRSKALKVEVTDAVGGRLGGGHERQHQAVAVAQVAGSVDRLALGASVDRGVAVDDSGQPVGAGRAGGALGAAFPPGLPRRASALYLLPRQ